MQLRVAGSKSVEVGQRIEKSSGSSRRWSNKVKVVYLVVSIDFI